MPATHADTVTITYTDDFRIWSSIRDDFQSFTPLQSVVCPSVPPRPAQLINRLPVQVVALNDYNAALTNVPSLLQAEPWLNLYWCNCEDVDTYRQVVRAKVQQWVDRVAAKHNQEWLIVHITGQSVAADAKGPKFLSRTTTVVDKLKADFSPKKDDQRVLTLNLTSHGSKDMGSWADLFARIKEAIAQRYVRLISKYEEDARRLDAQRMLPGWNYCTFFILKEKLVRTFAKMGMYGDALKQYDELEASFFQVLKDRALTWFTAFGGTTIGDDNTQLLQFDKKDYRGSILANSITVFDFRMYLFGRQCQLMLQLDRVGEFLTRARSFVPGFRHTMREFEKGLSPVFLAAWTFATYKNVVDVSESLLTDPLSSGHPNPHQVAALKAEFLANARRELDWLGQHFELLPRALAVCTANAPSHQPPAKGSAMDRSVITSPELVHGLENPAHFDNLYQTITNKAIRYYEDCKRLRFAQLLRLDLANLHFHRQSYAVALEEYTALLPPQCQYPPASRLLVTLYQHQIQCLQRLERWEELCTAYHTLLTMDAKVTLLTATDRQAYGHALARCAEQLPTGLTWADSPLFMVQSIASQDLTESIPNGAVSSNRVALTLSHSLGGPVTVDQIRLRVVGNEQVIPVQGGSDSTVPSSMDHHDHDDLWFYSDPDGTVLYPGPPLPVVAVTTTDSIPGVYTAEYLELRIGRIKFIYKLLATALYPQKFQLRVPANPLLPLVDITPGPVRVMADGTTQPHGIAANGSSYTLHLTPTRYGLAKGLLEIVPLEQLAHATLVGARRARLGRSEFSSDQLAVFDATPVGTATTGSETQQFSSDEAPSLGASPVTSQAQGRNYAGYCSFRVPDSETWGPLAITTSPPVANRWWINAQLFRGTATTASSIEPVPEVVALALTADGQIELPALQPRDRLCITFRPLQPRLDPNSAAKWVTLAQYTLNTLLEPLPTPPGARELPPTDAVTLDPSPDVTAPMSDCLHDATSRDLSPVSTPSSAYMDASSAVPIAGDLVMAKHFQRQTHFVDDRLPASVSYSIRYNPTGALLRTIVTAKTQPLLVQQVSVNAKRSAALPLSTLDADLVVYPPHHISGQYLLPDQSTSFMFQLPLAPTLAKSPTALSQASQQPNRGALECRLQFVSVSSRLRETVKMLLYQRLSASGLAGHYPFMLHLVVRWLHHATNLADYLVTGCFRYHCPRVPMLEPNVSLVPDEGITLKSRPNGNSDNGAEGLVHTSPVALEQVAFVRSALVYDRSPTQKQLLAVLGEVLHDLATLLNSAPDPTTLPDPGPDSDAPKYLGPATPWQRPRDHPCQWVQAPAFDNELVTPYHLPPYHLLTTVITSLDASANQYPGAGSPSLPAPDAKLGSINRFGLYPGQPCRVVITLIHACHEANQPSHSPSTTTPAAGPVKALCHYKLSLDVRDWLVVGPKSGQQSVELWEARSLGPQGSLATANGSISPASTADTVDSPPLSAPSMTSASSPLLPAQQTIELTLIPLRIGVLPLPRLHVTVQARASPFLVAHTVYRHTHTKVFVLPGGPMEPAVASKPSWGDEPPTVAVSDGPDVDGNTGHGYSSRSNTAYASQVIVTADAQGTLAARADPAFIRQ